jgi:ferredoxin--NADP+ reductase
MTNPAARQELRIAIIGSGPSGAFAAQALSAKADLPVAIDVFDCLPAPYGLVRYGVAPDHEKIKSIVDTFRQIFDQPGIRFLGNVSFGTDVTIADLRQHYDAIIVATGASADRRIGIAGEDLPGVFSATEFVAWYSGHPDAEVDRFTLPAESVVVVGVGNVALDVARILAKSPDELRATDVPEHVLDVLAASRIRDVHIVGRRGPEHARFSSKELLELGELTNADVLLNPAALDLDDRAQAVLAENPVARRTVKALSTLAAIPVEGKPRRVHIHFNRRPAELVGGVAVHALRVEQMAADDAGSLFATGLFSNIDAQMVLRSVGYRGLPIPGISFDTSTSTVPNDNGRVLEDNGKPDVGVYVVGWIKRGPSGVIGTNKRDSVETVTSLLADLQSLPVAPQRDPAAIDALLTHRGVHAVYWDGWQAIDSAEIALGQASGRGRVKIHDRASMLHASSHRSI